MSDDRVNLRADASVDDLLDGGAQGLRYFEEFLPKYQRWVGETDLTSDKLNAQYDMQRGMNLADLTADAEDLRLALAEADKQLAEQDGRAKVLATSWSGSAADGAQQYLTSHLARARTDREAMGTACDAMTTAADKLRQIVTDKVNIIRSYDSHTLDGKSPGDVDDIISGAGSSTLPTNPFGRDLAERLREMFALSMWCDDVDDIEEHCKKWMDQVFVPAFESHVQNLEQANTDAANRIHDVYNEISGALKAVDSTSYPQTGDPGALPPGTTGTNPPIANPGLTTGPSGGPGGGPGTAPGTSPASVVPTPTAPAAVAAPGLGLPGLGLPDLGQVGSLVGGLAEGACKTVEAISGAAGKAIADSLEQPKSHDDESGAQDDPLGEGDDKGMDDEAEFDVAGHHLKVEMGPDGQLKIEVVGPDGHPKTFGLSIDDKGIPVISTPECTGGTADAAVPLRQAEAPPAQAADGVGNQPVAPALPAGNQATPPPVAPPPVGSGMLGSRTERRDQPASNGTATPGDSNVVPESDSGAELAEAGPL